MGDIVNKIVGNFGIWQLRSVLIIFLCKIPASWFMACVIYTAPAPRDYEFRCTNQTFSNFSTYNENDENYNNQDQCFTESYSENISRFERVPCTNFEHKADFYSLVMQFDLVCSREILVAWTQFWHLFGVLSGGIVATKLMMYFSPRRVMLMGMIAQIGCGCITGLVDNFNVHCAFRCFSAICCALMFTAGQTIFSEITGGNYRLAVATLFDQFWSIGVILLPALAHLFHSWIFLYLAISLPTIILIFLYQWIPDAPLWLLRRGRIDEVEEMLIQAGDLNDRMHTIPSNLKLELQTLAESLKSAPPPATWWSLWEGPRAKIQFIAAHVAWTIYVTNFNGMLLNIRSFGREYLDINTIFTAISEIVGCFLALHFALNTRNKWMCAGIYNIIAGLIGCLGWLISTEWSETTRVAIWMILSSIPKAGVSISQSMLIAGTSELVSLPKRQIFTFSCIVVARIGLLTAPFINVLKVFDTALSLTAFSVLSLIGGIATCCLKSEIDLNVPNGCSGIQNVTIATNNTTTTLTKNDVPKRINVWTIDSQGFEKTKF